MERKTVGRRDAMKMIGAGAVAASGLLSSKSLLAQGNNPVVTVASVLSLSGMYAQYGLELSRGVQIAADAINSKGVRVGDKTYSIKVDTFDDKSDSTTSARLVERASSDGANIVIAGVGSLIGKAIIPIAQRTRTPVIAQWAHLDSVFAGQKGNPYYFSAMPPFSGSYDATWEQIPKLEAPKVRKVVMLSSNDEFGSFMSKVLPESLKKQGLELAHIELFPPGSQDFGATLERCARHNPDVFMIHCYSPQIIAVFKQMQMVKFFPATIVVQAPTHLVEAIGKPIDGVYAPAFWSPSVNTTKDQYIGTSADFARLYKAKYNAEPPDFVAACGANNVIVYAQALARTKSVTDTSGLLTSLRTLQGETFYSPVKFNEVGLNIGSRAYSAQFQQGKLVLVAPANTREATPIHPYPGWKKA
jgi:branched-chain amino acid transport system substrate-binding protein